MSPICTAPIGQLEKKIYCKITFTDKWAEKGVPINKSTDFLKHFV